MVNYGRRILGKLGKTDAIVQFGVSDKSIRMKKYLDTPKRDLREMLREAVKNTKKEKK